MLLQKLKLSNKRIFHQRQHADKEGHAADNSRNIRLLHPVEEICAWRGQSMRDNYATGEN